MLPATLGISGYIAPISVITVGYALFQTANNTAVMIDIRQDQRGVISGLLTWRAISGSSPVHPLWALCSRSQRGRSTSHLRVPKPLPPVCGSRSQSRRC
jgi:hypothetical protein